MRYKVRLLATTEREITLVLDADPGADPGDLHDRAVQMLRGGDVLPGLDYSEHRLGTEFLNDGVGPLVDEDEATAGEEAGS